MTTQEVKRKLVAILSVDVRRYSCLTGAVERKGFKTKDVKSMPFSLFANKGKETEKSI